MENHFFQFKAKKDGYYPKQIIKRLFSYVLKKLCFITFNENEREIDYVLLVSFSGFTYEEEKYADEHKICLVNRDGFENSINQKGNTILNLHNFEDLKRKHDMHRRK